MSLFVTAGSTPHEVKSNLKMCVYVGTCVFANRSGDEEYTNILHTGNMKH